MPWDIPSNCTYPGCANLAHGTSPRCSEHPYPTKSKYRHKATDSLRDSNSRKWEAIRQQVFRRDKHLCQPCQQKGLDTLAEEVDHIQAVSLGIDDTLDNLQAICRSCHSKKTNEEAQQRRERLKKSKYLRPDLLD